MSYIPLNIGFNTFALGVFSSEKEAKNAFIQFLSYHENFEAWLVSCKEDYKRLTDKEIPNDLTEVLFDYDEDFGDLYDEFWEERLAAIPIIEYSKNSNDFQFVANYDGWLYESKCNYLEKLILRIAYPDSEYAPDLKQLALKYPILLDHNI